MKITEIAKLEIGFYKNAFQTERSYDILFGQYLHFVKDGIYKDEVEKVRKIKDKERKRKAKAYVPAVTPSGLFSDRSDDGINTNKFSKIIVLDFDNPDNVELEPVKMAALSIPSTIAVHTSVGGNGLAIYVLVSEWKPNTYAFARLYYELMTGIELDKVTSNISRIRFISYDPDLVYNRIVEELVIPEPMKIERATTTARRSLTEMGDEDDLAVKLMKTVIENGDDPTADFYDWFRLGCAIAATYGEAGREYFQLVSSNYAEYDRIKVDKKYDEIQKLNNFNAGKGTIIYILSKYQ